MSLSQYKSKRKFNITPEPTGKTLTINLSRFVVQEHHASHLHYDFRLETEGVLKSWAVPKGVPEESGVKRLAVQVEDHPVEYINFSGIIPAGEYGAGEVIIWDKGKWGLISGSLASGALKFNLEGKKLKGDYALVRMKDSPRFRTRLALPAKRAGEASGKNWLIYKI